MSVEHMAMVFAAKGLDGGEKLLLLAYTNYTDPHGYCWPGEERLAEDTGTSVSTVRRTKKKLIGKNLVRSVRRPETSNLARVNLPLLASMARARRAYDDNEIDRLSFDGAPAADEPNTGPDQQTVQSDLSPKQAPDLRTVQSDLDHRSNCSDRQVNVTCGRGQSDLQSISDPPGEAISRPSLPADSSDSGSEGKDGSGMPSRSPGVDLLLAIGAEDPKFLLTGKTLTDQGLTMTGMLLEGWTEDQLRHIIAGRPLPDQVRTSVGAIVARRLRDAIASPPPASALQLPSQAVLGSHKIAEDTWTPGQWSARQGLDAAVATLHRAKCSECHRPLRDSAEDILCRDCREDATA
ncbi:helix-turn-helix domain-containing protein [Streptomyces sp. BE133]|uniref:helix-turn-helix domain-containing protein n=1 Tax=Streptomyces sp. BE133 TaxID=3002523 RepID=UPI002E7767D5|nr:helix-turn-helix domain-containing protein [Streptomyces sp. BE133]MEE1812617.1 helix-turn-helix domain-containing protein [Streptomyces sp. BE133]